MVGDSFLMDYSDMNLSTQLGLISLIVVVGAGFLVRTVIFFRRENAGTRPQYPNGWNEKQCLALEQFRLLIGLGLVTLWAAYLFFVPWVSPESSLGYLEVMSLVSMLSASYAWAVLLDARNWTRFDVMPRSFLVITVFLVLWWGTAFSAIGWVLTEASAQQPFRAVPLGVYADKEVSCLIEQA
jgi:hypothetical protein